MDTETPRWATMLISWAPFLVLIVVWFWFMRKGGMLGRQAKYMARSVEFMERQEKLLDRIAAALELRNKLQP
jgi:ATP-dependent Zn protease